MQSNPYIGLLGPPFQQLSYHLTSQRAENLPCISITAFRNHSCVYKAIKVKETNNVREPPPG